MVQERSSGQVILRKQKAGLSPILIVCLAVISYGRIYFFHDIVWDDNCWLLAAYTSGNLEQFLNTGFYELRRVPMGTFLYYLLSLHKTTNHAYLIWHSINIAVQVLTPVILYLFLKNLLIKRAALSFFIAICFIIFPLDYTLPYLTVTSYRIAILLTIISFYLLVKALIKENTNIYLFFISIIVSGISYYIFMETTVVFEPARMLIIGYLLYNKGVSRDILIKRATLLWLPFLLCSIPLIIYKLLIKPYGIYDGVYKTNLLFFFDWKAHRAILKILLLHEWKTLLKYIRDVRGLSIILGFFSIIFCFFMLKEIFSIFRTKNVGDSGILFMVGKRFEYKIDSAIFVLLLGIVLLIPQVVLLEFAGREISFGMNSSHFIPLQIGYSVIMGCLLYYFYSLKYLRDHLLRLLLSFIIGLGVFFNNLNLDMHFNSWERQNKFWRAFTTRFPSLPENATFMMDVRDFYFYEATDLDNAYDLEFILNLLYANSKRPEDFRKYKVFPLEEFRPEMADRFRCNQVNEERLERVTHFGKDALNPCEFIIVYYRDGKLLVNREIKEMLPDISYREWLKNDFPVLPDKPAAYPLRYKLKGFSDGNAL